MATPSISVVIATRNRGAAVVSAVQSVLATGDSESEVIVVDQSTDDCTRGSFQVYRNHPTVRYIASRSKGLGIARNIGIAEASCERIAITDDDCTVSRDWLAEMRRAFHLNPRIGIVFGNILAAAHDRSSDFIISYIRNGSYLARSLMQKHHVEGTGACMGIRKSVWDELGGFDPLLGAGSRFPAGEEVDLVLRALESGYAVYETEQIRVVHHGLRQVSQKSSVAHDYACGLGAVYAKHLKCGHWAALAPLFQLAVRWTWSGPVVDFGESPSRAARLRGFLTGVLEGARTRVNRNTVMYEANDAEAVSPRWHPPSVQPVVGQASTSAPGSGRKPTAR